MGYADGVVLFLDGHGGMKQVQPGCLSVGGSDARPFYLDCQKAVLPSSEIKSHAGEIRENGQIPETARSMRVLAVYYRQPRIFLHYRGTKESSQGADVNRKVAGDTGGEISRGTGQPFCFS